MSEKGTLVLEPVFEGDWWAVQRNMDRINDHVVGRGPAQARVYNDANIAVATGVGTALTFNTERYDTGNFHSTSSNTSRLTAPTAGLYTVGACVAWAGNATGVRAASLRVNGTDVIARELVDIDSATTHTHNVSTEYQLAAGDYVEVVVAQDSGGNLNVTANGNYSPEFWIHRIGSEA